MTQKGTPLQFGIEFNDGAKVFFYWNCGCGKTHPDGRTNFTNPTEAMMILATIAEKVIDGQMKIAYMLNPAPSLGEITK